MSRSSAWRGAGEHRRQPPGERAAPAPRRPRSPVVPRPSGRGSAPGTIRRRGGDHDQTEGRREQPGDRAKAVIRASSRPARQAARQRRSGSGSAKPSAAWANHGSRHGHDQAEPALAPGAGDHRHQGVRRAPIRSSHRGAPRGLTSRPTTRRNRQEPHSASGTASTSRAETVPGGAEERADQRQRQQIGGAGTSVPTPSGCHDSRCRPHQSPTESGTGESPPPVTAPYAGRARDQGRDHEDRQQDGDRVGEEPGDRAGVLEVLLRSSSRSLSRRRRRRPSTTGRARRRRLGAARPRRRPGR